MVARKFYPSARMKDGTLKHHCKAPRVLCMVDVFLSPVVYVSVLGVNVNNFNVQKMDDPP